MHIIDSADHGLSQARQRGLLEATLTTELFAAVNNDQGGEKLTRSAESQL